MEREVARLQAAAATDLERVRRWARGSGRCAGSALRASLEWQPRPVACDKPPTAVTQARWPTHSLGPQGSGGRR